MLLSPVLYSKNLQHGPGSPLFTGSLFLCGLQMGVMTKCAPKGLAVKQQAQSQHLLHGGPPLAWAWLGPMCCVIAGLHCSLSELRLLMEGGT